MSLYLRIICLLLLLTHTQCTNNTSSQKEKEPLPKHGMNLVALMVKDIVYSYGWYQEKLGFIVDKEIVEYPDYGVKVGFLQLGDFHLELVESQQSVPKSELSPSADVTLNGILKLGFLINDIDGLYNKLEKQRGVEFITTVQGLTETSLEIPWPKKHFMLYDPDGNLLQIFSHEDQFLDPDSMEPWLIMLTTKNLESTTSWYEKNMQFKYQTTVGDIGNKRAVLLRNNFVLELYQPSNVMIYDSLREKKEYIGFRKWGFATDNFEEEHKRYVSIGNEIVMPPQKGEMSWAALSMIVKDVEGNWVQLLDTGIK